MWKKVSWSIQPWIRNCMRRRTHMYGLHVNNTPLHTIIVSTLCKRNNEISVKRKSRSCWSVNTYFTVKKVPLHQRRDGVLRSTNGQSTTFCRGPKLCNHQHNLLCIFISANLQYYVLPSDISSKLGHVSETTWCKKKLIVKQPTTSTHQHLFWLQVHTPQEQHTIPASILTSNSTCHLTLSQWTDTRATETI